MAQTRLKSGNLHMVGGDNGTSGQVLKSRADGTFEWGEAIDPPTFSSVDYPGDDTALDPAGGQSLTINGTTFNAGVTVTIDGTTPSSITRNSATQLTVTTPAKSAGTYDLVISNTNGGTATASNAISYNGVPAFTNAAGSLGTVVEGDTVSLSAAATEPDGGAITYAITSGALPSGLSINANTGAITGTAPSVSASTTSNFTVTATDNENQSTARAYSITVNPSTIESHFKVLQYTGNGSTQTITGLQFQPDLVWIKELDTESWRVFDSTRGATQRIYFDSNGTQSAASDSLTGFTSSGFSLGSSAGVNQSSRTYMAYCFKGAGGTTTTNNDGSTASLVQYNSGLGMSIVKFSTNASGSKTWGHGLGAIPDLIILKIYTGETNDWQVWSPSIGEGAYLKLNTTDISASRSDSFSSVTTSTVTNSWTSASVDQIAYCFKNTDGFSKTGTYEGNGNVFGPIVETGFEPSLLIIKNIDNLEGGGSSWLVYDNKRSTTNPRDKRLFLNNNANSAQYSQYNVDFLSNGFQITNYNSNWGHNNDNQTYLYIAFAEVPDTTAPTLAGSFASTDYTGNGATGRSFTGLSSPNLIWNKQTNGTTAHTLTDTVRGISKYLVSSSNNEQQSSSYYTSFNSDGWTYNNNALNASGEIFINWGWKADDNEPTILLEDTYAAAYKFDESNSGETADDLSGNFDLGNDNVTFTTTAKFTRAADFNGSNGRFYNNSFTPLVGSNAYSVSLWFYGDTISGSSGDQWLWGVGNQTNFTDTSIYIRNNNTIFHDNWGNSDYIANASVSLSASTWYHFVFVYDGAGTGTGYLNGTKLSDFSRTLDRTGSTLRIGCRHNETNHFNGKMDQIRFYTQALNQTQVNALYNESSSNNSTLEFPSGISGAKVNSIVSANTNAGFSIVKYAGNDFVSKIKHGLGGTPDMIIIKRLNGGAGFNWIVGHTGMDYTNNYTLTLDGGSYATWNYFNATAPTSTVFELGTGANTSSVNADGGQYIAYCWRSITGYSKFGSYTSNASTKITTGFEPTMMMFHYKATGDWYIQDLNDWDGSTYGANGGKLIKIYYKANDNGIPTPVPTGGVEVMSDGFYPTNWFNTSNGTIYAAWKEN